MNLPARINRFRRYFSQQQKTAAQSMAGWCCRLTDPMPELLPVWGVRPFARHVRVEFMPVFQ